MAEVIDITPVILLRYRRLCLASGLALASLLLALKKEAAMDS